MALQGLQTILIQNSASSKEELTEKIQEWEDKNINIINQPIAIATEELNKLFKRTSPTSTVKCVEQVKIIFGIETKSNLQNLN